MFNLVTTLALEILPQASLLVHYLWIKVNQVIGAYNITTHTARKAVTITYGLFT